MKDADEIKSHLVAHAAAIVAQGPLSITSYRRYKDEHPDSGLPTLTEVYLLFGTWRALKTQIELIASAGAAAVPAPIVSEHSPHLAGEEAGVEV